MEWRSVPNTDGYYEVSDTGLVRSWCNSRHPRRKEPLILKYGTLPKGHKQVSIFTKTRLVHHLVLEAFVGPRPSGMETRHLDGNPANNTLQNLCYGVPKENHVDRIKHGVSNRGKGGKLRVQDVLEIRASNAQQKVLAREFGVSQTTISEIKRHRKWSWLESQGY